MITWPGSQLVVLHNCSKYESVQRGLLSTRCSMQTNKPCLSKVMFKTNAFEVNLDDEIPLNFSAKSDKREQRSCTPKMYIGVASSTTLVSGA